MGIELWMVVEQEGLLVDCRTEDRPMDYCSEWRWFAESFWEGVEVDVKGLGRVMDDKDWVEERWKGFV
jgi:hypothetical protein